CDPQPLPTDPFLETTRQRGQQSVHSSSRQGGRAFFGPNLSLRRGGAPSPQVLSAKKPCCAALYNCVPAFWRPGPRRSFWLQIRLVRPGFDMPKALSLEVFASCARAQPGSAHPAGSAEPPLRHNAARSRREASGASDRSQGGHDDQAEGVESPGSLKLLLVRGLCTQAQRSLFAGEFAQCHALRSAKCAPQKATTAPRQSAAMPASPPEIVGIGLGAAAAWPAPASSSTPTAIRNWRIRRGICPSTALCIRFAVK